jgi:glutamyl-tRNA reductase
VSVSILVIGANHRTAPLELLEKLSVDGESLPKYLDALMARDNIAEAVILSTCHRTEIYAVAERFHGAFADVRDLISDITFLPPESFADHLEIAYDTDAVAHLFAVSAGLDSVVVGEHEILGQVRDAWESARGLGASGPTLNLLFRHALEVGKRARTETAIARGVTSVSQAAVVMATEHLGTLAGATAVVLGAGEMGRNLVTLLTGAEVDEIIVVNRTPQAAQQIATDAGARAAQLASLTDELVGADVLFTSTSSPTPLLGTAELDPVLARRNGRPLLVVDIAMPRDVDPAVAELDGVTVLDLEALESFAERGLTDRRREVPAVEAIVAAECDRFEAVRTSREVAPLVAELHAWAEGIRASEVERLAGRTGDPAVRKQIDALSRALVAKLLHTPTVRVKDAAGTPKGERLASSLRDLFDL